MKIIVAHRLSTGQVVQVQEHNGSHAVVLDSGTGELPYVKIHTPEKVKEIFKEILTKDERSEDEVAPEDGTERDETPH